MRLRYFSEKRLRYGARVLLTLAFIGALQQPIGYPAPRNETWAIISLKVLATAQVAFAASCGNGGFAASLDDLATPIDSAGDPFLPADVLQRLRDRGYLVTMTPTGKAGQSDCRGLQTTSGFYAAAVPAAPNVTGQRAFAVNAVGVIWFVNAPTAPPEPFGPPAEAIR